MVSKWLTVNLSIQKRHLVSKFKMAALGGADTDNIDDLLDGEDEGKNLYYLMISVISTVLLQGSKGIRQ